MIVRVVILALVMMLVGGGLILLAHSTTEPIRLVVYSAEVNGNRDIYIKTVGGTYVRRLTTDPARDYTPAWSPDGKWIAYASNKIVSWGYYPVYLVNIDGSYKEEIGCGIHPDGVWSINWSPNGKWVFAGGTDCSIVNLEQGISNFIDYQGWPEWTTDSQWMIFNTMYYEGQSGIIKLRPDLSEYVFLSTEYSNFSPILSPDGQWLVFESSHSSTCTSFFIVNIDGSQLKCVGKNGKSPSWSTDSQWVLFASESEDTASSFIYKFNVNNGSQQPILEMSGSVRKLLWTPYNDTIFFVGDNELYKVHSDGSELQLLVSEMKRIYSLMWLKEENRLVFYGSKPKNVDYHLDGYDGLFWIKPDGSELEYIAELYNNTIENSFSPIRY